MNNNAFKDLVRSYGGKNYGKSSKEIARKAVEEEFRKKKRKHADYSSDEDDDNRQSSYNKVGKGHQQEEIKKRDHDDAKAIQKDLSSRYRDRAKERREGKVANTDEDTDQKNDAGSGVSNDFLIVPHNIKGLDLALARKERDALQSRSSGESRQSTTAANAGDTDEGDFERTNKIRDQVPTLNQANQILQAYLLTEYGKTANDGNYDDYSSPITISNGIAEYLSEIVNWKTLDISTWEGEPVSGAAARNSLQHTNFSLAIDGNPSDSTRAWEIPRQYTLSRGNASGGVASSPPLLPIDLINKIDRVFLNKNFIREQMMKRQTLKSNQSRTTVNGKKERKVVADKNNNVEIDDDQSDEDMFGGLED